MKEYLLVPINELNTFCEKFSGNNKDSVSSADIMRNILSSNKINQEVAQKLINSVQGDRHIPSNNINSSVQTDVSANNSNNNNNAVIDTNIATPPKSTLADKHIVKQDVGEESLHHVLSNLPPMLQDNGKIIIDRILQRKDTTIDKFGYLSVIGKPEVVHIERLLKIILTKNPDVKDVKKILPVLLSSIPHEYIQNRKVTELITKNKTPKRMRGSGNHSYSEHSLKYTTRISPSNIPKSKLVKWIYY